MNEYSYIVKVYINDEIKEYQYESFTEAMDHYNTELSKGNNTKLFRSKDGKLERYVTRNSCNCGSCNPKRIQYKPKKAN